MTDTRRPTAEPDEPAPAAGAPADSAAPAPTVLNGIVLDHPTPDAPVPDGTALDDPVPDEAPPGRFTPEQEARLAELDRRATRHVDDNRPQKTRDSYKADWKAWRRFCAETGLPELAVRSGTLVLFVEWLWRQPGRKPGTYTAPATIDRRLTGVVVTARRKHQLPLSGKVAEEARALLKARKKEMEEAGEERGYGKAPALLVAHMEAIAPALPDSLMGARDLSMMTMSVACLAREHELAWLRVRDVTEDPEDRGLLVNIRVSKVAPRLVRVRYGSRLALCPVRAWRRWKAAAGLDADPDGFAFRRLHNRWHTLLPGGMSPEAVGDVITRISARADLGVRHGGHSPRRGGAEESRRAGNDRKVIAAQGGWVPHSAVMEGYFENPDGWTENAMNGVL